MSYPASVRAHARELRERGGSVPCISLQLGVAKSTVSLWVRDMPSPFGRTRHERQVAKSALGGAVVQRRSAQVRAQTKLAAALDVGDLSDRELLLVGVALYWAEGAKDKPYARRERVALINSDPRLVRLFLRWLRLVGVPPDDLTFRVNIHESADRLAAERYWAHQVGIETSRLAPTTVKRTREVTNRKNTGTCYHGCLVIDVRRSSELYRRIEGWWYGIALAARAVEADG